MYRRAGLAGFTFLAVVAGGDAGDRTQSGDAVLTCGDPAIF